MQAPQYTCKNNSFGSTDKTYPDANTLWENIDSYFNHGHIYNHAVQFGGLQAWQLMTTNASLATNRILTAMHIKLKGRG